MPSEPATQRLALAMQWLADHAPVEVVVSCPVCASDPHPASDPVSRGVHVILESRLGEAAEDVLVDLLVASGGERLVIAACECSPASRFARLESLTSGRITCSESVAFPAQRLEVARPPVSRRGMFRPRAAAPVVEHVAEDAQGRLVESLRALGVGDAPGESPALQLAVQGCIACRVCVRSCPQDALELRTASGRTTLAQHPDRCLGDRDCVASCPVDAISVAGHLGWEPVIGGRPIPLARLETRECDRCRAVIPRGQSHCDPCRRRVAEPFGTHLPEHVRAALPQHWRDRLG